MCCAITKGTHTKNNKTNVAKTNILRLLLFLLATVDEGTDRILRLGFPADEVFCTLPRGVLGLS